MKTCYKCGETRPLEEFPPYKASSDGRKAKCSGCYQTGRTPRQRVAKEAKPLRKQRICTGCRETLPIDTFKDDPEGRAGKDSMCRPCRSDRELKYRLTSWGLTPESFAELLASQGGGCAICGARQYRDGSDGTRFAIDHDHSCCPGPTGCQSCIRGLLCMRCNLGLGAFRDDANAMEAASGYIRWWQGERRSRDMEATLAS